MSNKLQCPQCGASNSTKISETEQHCDYCDCNFAIAAKPGEIYTGDLFKKSTEFKATINERAEAIGKRNKRIAMLVFLLIAVLIGVIIVCYKMKGN